jgi:hypothetical protein
MTHSVFERVVLSAVQDKLPSNVYVTGCKDGFVPTWKWTANGSKYYCFGNLEMRRNSRAGPALQNEAFRGVCAGMKLVPNIKLDLIGLLKNVYIKKKNIFFINL